MRSCAVMLEGYLLRLLRTQASVQFAVCKNSTIIRSTLMAKKMYLMYYLVEDGSRVYTFEVSSKNRENILFIGHGGLVLTMYVMEEVVLCRIF
jgi:hypothetical protein